MKFIRKHLNEGIFKTAAQVAKQREKEAAMSDEEIVALNTTNTINNKVQSIISRIIIEREILPFNLNTLLAYPGLEGYQITYEKLDIKCNVSVSNGEPVISIDYNLGALMKKKRNPQRITNFSLDMYYNDNHLTILSENKINKNLEKRIKEFIKKEYNANPINKPIYDFILGSSIVLNNISIFEGVDNVTMTIPFAYDYSGSWTWGLSEESIQYDPSTPKGFKQYEKYLDALTKIISFDSVNPVKIVIHCEKTVDSNTEKYLAKYNSLSEIEKYAGIGDAIEDFAKDKTSYKQYNMMYNKFKICKYFRVEYSRDYVFEITQKTYKFVGKGEAEIVSFRADETDYKQSKYHIDIRYKDTLYSATKDYKPPICVIVECSGRSYSRPWLVTDRDEIYNKLLKLKTYLEKIVI